MNGIKVAFLLAVCLMHFVSCEDSRKESCKGIAPEKYLGQSKKSIADDIARCPDSKLDFLKQGNKVKWHWIGNLDVKNQKIDASSHTTEFVTFFIEPYFATLSFDEYEACDTVNISIYTGRSTKKEIDIGDVYYRAQMKMDLYEGTVTEDITPKWDGNPNEIRMAPTPISRTKTIYKNSSQKMEIIKEFYRDGRDSYDRYQIRVYKKK